MTREHAPGHPVGSQPGPHGLPDRIRQKFEVDASGCWLWIASREGGGYGHVSVNGKLRPSHRVVYELLVGQIPAGLHLDHLCRVRHCVNPAHLEPVTNRENYLRGDAPAVLAKLAEEARANRPTHCPSGHEYTEDNVYVTDQRRGYRRCRRCLLDYMKRRKTAGAS